MGAWDTSPEGERAAMQSRATYVRPYQDVCSAVHGGEGFLTVEDMISALLHDHPKEFRVIVSAEYRKAIEGVLEGTGITLDTYAFLGYGEPSEENARIVKTIVDRAESLSFEPCPDIATAAYSLVAPNLWNIIRRCTQSSEEP